MHRFNGSARLPLHRRTRPISNAPGCPIATASSTRSDSSRKCDLATERAGDHEMLDLVRALADLEHLGVAIEACDRRVEHVAETTVDLHGFRGGVHREPA